MRSSSRQGHLEFPARLVRTSLFGGTVWLVVAALVTGGVAGNAKKKKVDTKGMAEVRQGGYVEKVEPGVDYKNRLPRIPAREPAESMKGFHIIPGFRIEQVAAEPLICDSIDMAFDENGRMYVVEMIPYAEGGTSVFGSPDGRVSLLEDTDNDGKFDKSTVFAEEFVWPTGVTCFDGGVYIVSAPDLWYCKDTDGDGKADIRELVLTGFLLTNPNGLPNSLRWGLDSRVHGMTSSAGGLLEPVQWKKTEKGRDAKSVESRGRDFSIHPRTGELRLESGGAQFGMTFDDWGRKFESSNSWPIEMVMYADRYIARNPYLAAPNSRLKIWKDGSTVYRTSPVEPWRAVRTEMRVRGVFSGPVEGGGTPAGYFTAACGLMIYRGNAWPKEFHGNAFVCEGAGNLVHRMRLQPDGVAFSAHRTEKETEFLTSDEIWFRPIQFTNAPDGAFYLADMYREIYEHPDAVPPSAKKYLDLTCGKDRGRIYRFVPEGFKQPAPVRLGKASTAQLVQLLAHPNGWHRTTASRLLYERQDPSAVEPLRALCADPASPLGRMHALWALLGQKSLTAELVLARLDDEHPRVREHAVRLAEEVLADAPAVRAKLYAMAADADMRVRYQLAFTLGEISGTQATAALAQIARQDVTDRWMRLAVLSSCFGRAGQLFSDLVSDTTWRKQKESRAFLEQLAQQVGLQKRDDQVAEVFKLLDGLAKQDRTLARLVVRGLSKGLTESRSPWLAKLTQGGESLAGKMLTELIAQAKTLATSSKASAKKRAQAVRSLAMASFDDVSEVLGELLDGRQPRQVQMAALQTLSRFNNEQVATMIVEAWQGFTPEVRGEAAEAIFSRTERLRVLLTALEDEEIRRSQLDPARIQFLLEHPDNKIRAEAKRILGSAQLARREKVVESYREALKMKGDVQRGREVFKKECGRCHRLEGVGYDLGLPLQTIKTRGPDGILLNVLDPNREVNPAYLNYIVLMDDGRLVTGMITAETATSITLSRAEGESDTVLRTNIEEMRSTDLSIMPEGLEEQVNKPAMADLIAYLLAVGS